MEVKFDHMKFRKLVENRTISQQTLAELAGTTDRYIRAMITGQRTNPSAAVLCSICQVLGCPVEDCMSPSLHPENENISW